MLTLSACQQGHATASKPAADSPKVARWIATCVRDLKPCAGDLFYVEYDKNQPRLIERLRPDRWKNVLTHARNNPGSIVKIVTPGDGAAYQAALKDYDG
ncbi:MAG: hypothetical protein V4480_04325 [Patescibacteria group bacterium]